jgi:hypothetical protein
MAFLMRLDLIFFSPLFVVLFADCQFPQLIFSSKLHILFCVKSGEHKSLIRKLYTKTEVADSDIVLDYSPINSITTAKKNIFHLLGNITLLTHGFMVGLNKTDVKIRVRERENTSLLT